MAAELTSVSDDDVVLFDGAECRRYTELRPDRLYELDGVAVRTLPRLGELLTTVATVNDVHFGETVCGVIEGADDHPTFSVGPGEPPYPDTMNRGAIAEIGELGPDAVVVKGDLTSNGTVEEYRRFLSFYEPAFGDRLHHVHGNHDSYHGESFAAVSTQEVVLDGVILAILDTARLRQVNGSIDADQAEWLDELGSRADRPVLVFGHHHMWDPDRDSPKPSFFGIRPTDAGLLLDVFARRDRLVGYFAGHTHRNRRQTLSACPEVPWVEVACVKDFPGSWAEYRVFEGGILQVHRRIATPEALEWTERTRGMFHGLYPEYAFGRLEDRCFVMPAGVGGRRCP